MLDTLIIILLVTLFVLGLIALVQWVLKFFPSLNSARLNPPVRRWWIVLFGIFLWLNILSALLKKESPSAWTKSDYVNLFNLFVFTYFIVHDYKSTTNQSNESTQEIVPEDSSKSQP